MRGTTVCSPADTPFRVGWTPSRRPRRCPTASAQASSSGGGRRRQPSTGSHSNTTSSNSRQPDCLPAAAGAEVSSRWDELVTSVSRRAAAVVLAAVVATSAALAPALPAGAVSNEQLLYLEAWRAVDRAYVDKKFKGQIWFMVGRLCEQGWGPREGDGPPCLAWHEASLPSYSLQLRAAARSLQATSEFALPSVIPSLPPWQVREDGLKKVPMLSRADTHAAIRSLLASLGDPFTRFLDPDQFSNLRWVLSWV